jgi:hypothetical protein
MRAKSVSQIASCVLLGKYCFLSRCSSLFLTKSFLGVSFFRGTGYLFHVAITVLKKSEIVFLNCVRAVFFLCFPSALFSLGGKAPHKQLTTKAARKTASVCVPQIDSKHRGLMLIVTPGDRRCQEASQVQARNCRSS